MSFIAKTIIILLIAVAAFYFALSRSGKKEAANDESEGTPDKSTAQTAVDGFTGKTAVHMGKKARQKIDKINTSRSEDIKKIEAEGQ